MYINFQQNRVCRSVKTEHTNLFAKMASCINLQLPIVILKKSILFDMHHHKTHQYINFQRNLVGRSIKTVRTNLFTKKIASCINLQPQKVNLKKSIMSDIYHCITYMYINFQPNRVSRSVKTVHTNIFAKIASCINL